MPLGSVCWQALVCCNLDLRIELLALRPYHPAGSGKADRSQSSTVLRLESIADSHRLGAGSLVRSSRTLLNPP